jgi:YidC/Oxa1 family membrane protein insertase
MKSNTVVAVLFSMAIVLLWDKFMMAPQREAARRALPPAPAVSAGRLPAAAPAVGPVVHRERLSTHTVGQNRVTLNAYGGGVSQWDILEHEKSGAWVPLVYHPAGKAPYTPAPLTTFPDRVFDIALRENKIIMTSTGADGLTIIKTLALAPQGHLHTLEMRLSNAGKAPLTADYSLGWGPGLADTDPAFERGLAYDPPRLIKFGKPLTQEGPSRWWGVDGHYFLAAFLNPDGKPIPLAVDRVDKHFTLTKTSPVLLAPGETRTDDITFYLGPKKYDGLKALNLGLERSVDFGFFAPIGKAIHWTLLRFHRALGNFGWSIILLTLIIQTVVFPLTVKSFRHAQKMKALQPQLKRLQEIHKGNPQRLNQEMLALYRRHGMRFMGMEGCVPMLVQLPVFWALFSTLRNTYELRHAPWLGWITDLSLKDPFYVLPLLMGAGMFAQQKMMAAKDMDPTQKQMMYMMPIIFTAVSINFPSGLVLYWITNSAATIAVQLFLMQRASVASPPHQPHPAGTVK